VSDNIAGYSSFTGTTSSLGTRVFSSGGLSNTGTPSSGINHVRCMRRHNTPMPAAPIDRTPFFETRFGGTTVDRLIEHTGSLSARTSSREFTVRGINTPVTFTLGGSGSPALRINGGPEVTTGTINPTDRVRVVATSAASAGQSVVANFTIGGSPTMNYVVRTTDPTNIKRIFVTSSTHTGNMGGLGGANTICAARAGDASLPGATTYRALLSSNVVNAFDVIDWRTGRFENIRGDLLANDLDDLMSGRILNPVLTETSAASTNTVWTFMSGNNGAPLAPSATSGNSCSNFFSTSGNCAGMGHAAAISAWLTSGGTQACTNSFSLYCYGPN
jgi:hypothetical protein